MTVVAAFSTDFSSEPVLDEMQSKIQGRDIFVRGAKRLLYGGTFKTRGAMPLMAMGTFGDDWDVHLAWRFQVAPDGHIQTLDMQGNWHDPDILYQQRWMHREGVEQFRRARATGQKIISDLDDLFWGLPKTNIAYETTDPKRNPEFNRDHYWNNLAASDAITVSTHHLYKTVERLGLPTYVLRNAVDIEEWPLLDAGSDGYIGWVGGIQWRAHDLHILRAVGLPEWLADTGVGMMHGGDSQVPGVPKFWEQIGIDPDVVECISAPLCPIWEYPKLWEPMRISLIPLEKVPFNQSKSWLKQLESCACGLPYIVSAGFHEQRLLIDEGTAGREARNTHPRDWKNHLDDLLDPEVRRKEGAVNRAVAEQHDIRKRWVEWDAAYKEIVAL